MTAVEGRKSSDANIVDDVIGKGDGSEVYLQYCEVDKSYSAVALSRFGSENPHMIECLSMRDESTVMHSPIYPPKVEKVL